MRDLQTESDLTDSQNISNKAKKIVSFARLIIYAGGVDPDIANIANKLEQNASEILELVEGSEDYGREQ